MALDVSMDNLSQDTLRIAPTNAAGGAAAVDGVPVWASSDETIATVIPAADGLSCVVRSVDGAIGVCQVTVSADADLGAGVTTIGDMANVTINGAQAVALGMSADAPVAKQ